MTPRGLQSLVLNPGLSLLPSKMDTHNGRVMLTAIAIQESGLSYRHQVGGPAHGLWQFESGGGTRGVLHHRASSPYSRPICVQLLYDPSDEKEVFAGIEHNDLLACVFARLLLWTLPQALPDTEDEGWSQYMEAWRPGRPHRGRWRSAWRQAVEAVTF